MQIQRRGSILVKLSTVLVVPYLVAALLASVCPGFAQQAADIPNQFAIKAAVPNAPRLVLKFGNRFLLMDQSGSAPVGNAFGLGLYCDDTRYLSGWQMSLDGAPLTLLSSETAEGYAGRFVYSNQQTGSGSDVLPDQKILVERHILIDDDCLREGLKLTNYDVVPRSLVFSIRYDADFADMFEVRGQTRARRGQFLAARTAAGGEGIFLPYAGLDGKKMTTSIAFSQTPAELKPRSASFQLRLKPGESWSLNTAVATTFERDVDSLPEVKDWSKCKGDADVAYRNWKAGCASISTDNPKFDAWLERSFRDLYILRQSTPRGNCIAAGVPWFAVAFGRDQEITSLETLPFIPSIAHDVLHVLSQYQGTAIDTVTEEQPGRILHELRLGEMARNKEIPFRPYYGTVDATPLFLVLLGAYAQSTGDLEFARAHWPNAVAAMKYLDANLSDGYLRYGGNPNAPLTNQGWKDSYDSVMYDDGHALAKPPIALCEPQGYLYYGWNSLANLAARLGMPDEEKRLRALAQSLQSRFQRDFWSARTSYPALALDGDGKQVDPVSSNGAQLLFTGILNADQCDAVANRLQQSDMFSGWGVRTLSSKSGFYNPMSYHDGSVWPHDDAIIAGGLGSTGRSDLAAAVAQSLFEAALTEPEYRLPELFCGFDRHYSDAPVRYPVSCSPQAWAAASPFMLLQGALGLSLNANDSSIHLYRPHLPPAIGHITISNLHVGTKRGDLTIERSGDKVETRLSTSDAMELVVKQ